MDKRFIKYLFSLSLLLCITKIHAQETYWGVTSNGGTDNLGTIGHYIQSESKWVTDFADFTTPFPGSTPDKTQLTELNGKFYGVTSNGGSYGKGVIFEWDPATNDYVKEIDFDGTNGSTPQCTLILSNDKFYGMTTSGGPNNFGVIFEWDPVTNIYSKKYDFNFTTGSTPQGSLAAYGGKFYGMTIGGGANSLGGIFEWDPVTGNYTNKIDFSTSIGNNPLNCGLVLIDNKFYATTQVGGANGGGVIFEWDPVSNIYTKKIDLASSSGTQPIGSLVYQNGKFYGVTSSGGANNLGVIFEWDPLTNVYTSKIDLNSQDGSFPNGFLTYAEEKFYGMMRVGGTTTYGAIFEWDPSTNTYTKKIDLPLLSSPSNTLTYYNNKFYGLTTRGGKGGAGTIFEWDITNNTCTTKIDFNYAINGSLPSASLNYFNGKFYGTTNSGGSNGYGVIFEWNPSTLTYSKKFDFNIDSGTNPREMVLYNDKFYGMTQNYGVIFEWDPSTNTYTKRNQFSPAIGSSFITAMTFKNGKFYNIGQSGGANAQGTILEWDPTLNIVTKKIDLTIANGYASPGQLIDFNDKFYSTTFSGGSNFAGVIFQWDPANNVYTKKYDFAISSGSNPTVQMTFVDSKFYGVTTNGMSTFGAIFSWDPIANLYTKKLSTNASTGKFSSPLLYNGQVFYGTTSTGGANGNGILYEWNSTTNALTKKFDFTAATGSVSTKLIILNCTPPFKPSISLNSTNPESVILTSSSSSGNQWYLNGTAIPGAVNQIYTTTTLGSYKVQITSGDCQSDFSDEAPILCITPARPSINLNNQNPEAPLITSSASTGNQWFLNDVAITVAINQTYTVTMAGTYKVQISSGDCKSSFSDIVTITCIPPTKPSINLNNQNPEVPTLQSSVTTGNQWYLNDLPITEATNQTYVVALAGKYKVQASSGDCKSIFSDIVTISCIAPPKPSITLNNQNPEAPLLSSSANTGNQWYLNDTAIAGATNQTYTATSGGKYKVQVSSGDCKSAFSEVLVLIVTSVLEPSSQNQFHVYPNPVDSYLTLNGIDRIKNCVITDVSGKQQSVDINKSGNGFQVDVREYKAGLYFVSIQTEEGIYRVKFLKK